MSESDVRVASKGNAIEVFKTNTQMQVLQEEEERSEWIGPNMAIDKIGRVCECEEQEELILPSGVDMNWIKEWVPKAVKTLNTNKVIERKEGRTGLEQWAMPMNYAFIPGSMGAGGSEDMVKGYSDVHSRGIDIACLIYDEISIHGRETIDEIVRNIGAIEPQLLTVVVNIMIKDKFLKIFYEEDGLKTLELIEAHTRNRSLGIVPEEKPKELEDKDSKRNIGGTPDKPEDVVTTYQFGDDGDNLIVDKPPNFKLKDSQFENG